MATAIYNDKLMSSLAPEPVAAITHYAIRTGEVGNDRIIAVKEFASALPALFPGQYYEIEADEIVVTQTEGDATPDGAKWILQQALAEEDVFMSLHTANPDRVGYNSLYRRMRLLADQWVFFAGRYFGDEFGDEFA